jgi:hypothetical protein
MKKTLLLAGAVAAFALLNLRAGSADGAKAPDSSACTNKTAATCPAGGAAGARAACPKTGKAARSCPMAAGNTNACAKTQGACSTQKPAECPAK